MSVEMNDYKCVFVDAKKLDKNMLVADFLQLYDDTIAEFFIGHGSIKRLNDSSDSVEKVLYGVDVFIPTDTILEINSNFVVGSLENNLTVVMTRFLHEHGHDVSAVVDIDDGEFGINTNIRVYKEFSCSVESGLSIHGLMQDVDNAANFLFEQDDTLRVIIDEQADVFSVANIAKALRKIN